MPPSTPFSSGWRRQCVCGKCCCEHWVHSNRACTAVRCYGEEIQHKHIQKECTFHLRLITSLRPPLGGLLLETIQLFATRAEAWQAIPGVSDWVLGIIKWGYTLQFARRPPRLAAWSPHRSSIAMMLTFISRWLPTTGDSWDSPLREWLISTRSSPLGCPWLPRLLWSVWMRLFPHWDRWESASWISSTTGSILLSLRTSFYLTDPSV